MNINGNKHHPVHDLQLYLLS